MPTRDSLDPFTSMWHWIASDLRFYRNAHGMTGTQLGEVIGVQRSTVSNYEASRENFHLNEAQAARLDKLWGLNDHFRKLVRWANSATTISTFETFRAIESVATEIRIYHSLLIPGLLQTERYMRAIFSRDDTDDEVSARLERQHTLERNRPPALWVLLDEDALTRPIGGAEVMREQLDKLLELSVRHSVCIRVIPRSTGHHPGLSGSFTIFTVDGSAVIHTETASALQLLRQPDQTSRYARRYEQIGAQALPEGMTRTRIEQIREEIGT